MNETDYFDPRAAAAYDAAIAREAVTRDDIPFYVALARDTAARGTVLELGCGTGRVTLPIAAAGIPVIGLDSSSAMLDVARSKAGSAANPTWLQADMAAFNLDLRFGLVLIPFRSLLLLTQAQRRACLDRAWRHLVEDGLLAFNVFNPAPLLSAAAGRLTNGRRGSRMAYTTRSEIETLLALTGFRVEALYGWFDRRPFTDESSEMVWIARRSESREIDDAYLKNRNK